MGPSMFFFFNSRLFVRKSFGLQGISFFNSHLLVDWILCKLLFKKSAFVGRKVIWLLISSFNSIFVLEQICKKSTFVVRSIGLFVLRKKILKNPRYFVERSFDYWSFILVHKSSFNNPLKIRVYLSESPFAVPLNFLILFI